MAERWLVIDDSATIQRVIKLAFQDYDVAITEAESCPEATRELGKAQPTLVIADAALAGVQSVQDFVALQQLAPGSVFVILEGSYDHIDETQFRSVGFKHFLKKPFDAAQLIATTRGALGRNILKRGEEPPARILPTDSFVPPPQEKTEDPRPTQRGMLLDPADDGAATPEASTQKASSPFDAIRPSRQSDESPRSGGGSSAFDLGLDDAPAARTEAAQSRPFVSPPSEFGVSVTQTKIMPVNFSLDDDEAESEVPANKSPAAREPMPTQGRDPIATSNPFRDFGTNARDPLPNARVDAPVPSAKTETSQGNREGASPNASLSGMLQPMLQQEMEKMVRAAVEDYCRRNFAELARELIVRELDRLTQERSRLLVDK